LRSGWSASLFQSLRPEMPTEGTGLLLRYGGRWLTWVVRTMDQKRRRFVCDGMLWEAWPSDLPPDPRVSEARAALPPSPPRLFFKSSTGMFRAVPYATASWAGLARMSDDDLRDIVRGLDYYG
jgi:hypothetical protein